MSSSSQQRRSGSRLPPNTAFHGGFLSPSSAQGHLPAFYRGFSRKRRPSFTWLEVVPRQPLLTARTVIFGPLFCSHPTSAIAIIDVPEVRPSHWYQIRMPPVRPKSCTTQHPRVTIADCHPFTEAKHAPFIWIYAMGCIR